MLRHRRPQATTPVLLQTKMQSTQMVIFSSLSSTWEFHISNMLFLFLTIFLLKFTHGYLQMMQVKDHISRIFKFTSERMQVTIHRIVYATTKGLTVVLSCRFNNLKIIIFTHMIRMHPIQQLGYTAKKYGAICKVATHTSSETCHTNLARPLLNRSVTQASLGPSTSEKILSL